MDVAWAQCNGLMADIIASVGEDGKVIIWRSEALNPKSD